jgi:hypothetical protein
MSIDLLGDALAGMTQRVAKSSLARMCVGI